MEKLKSKENILYIIIVVIISFATSLSVYAATINYQSSDVWYDNSSSHLTSSNVKGALDELHSTATNYNDITTRTNTLSSYFSATTVGSDTIYPYTYDGANLGINNASGVQSGVDFYYSGAKRAAIYSTSNGLVVAANNASGTEGQGTLNLRGDPIRINGNDVSYLTDGITQKSTDNSSTSYSGSSNINLGVLEITQGTWIVTYGGYTTSTSASTQISLEQQDGQGGDYKTYISWAKGLTDTNTLHNETVIIETSSNRELLLMVHPVYGSGSVYGRIWATKIK